MAAVSITAMRVSSIEFGDSVAVIGGGIVGNLAAQMAGLSGAKVLLIDPVETRREAALACGISRTSPSVKDLSGAETFSTVNRRHGLFPGHSGSGGTGGSPIGNDPVGQPPGGIPIGRDSLSQQNPSLLHQYDRKGGPRMALSRIEGAQGFIQTLHNPQPRDHP